MSITQKNIVIGIDASRCRSGGAVAHLIGILSSLDPVKQNIKHIHVWSYKGLLDRIPNFIWLTKHNPVFLEKNLIFQLFWQLCILKNELDSKKCDVLFTLDASTLCNFENQIVLSQDMLSYEPGIMKLFGFGLFRLRLILILYLQNNAFKRSIGVIFLTDYSSKVIQSSTGRLSNFAVIPHGIDEMFKNVTKKNYNFGEIIRCLYISNTDFYKFQWHVVNAVEILRQRGMNISLDLVGGGSGKSQALLDKQIRKSDPQGIFVQKIDFLNQNDLPDILRNSDIFVFASGCENMPVTLLEAMATGIPIACSNRGPMPDIMNDSGILFNPEDPTDIANAIQEIIMSLGSRIELSKRSKTISRQYSWERCANSTFSFIYKSYIDKEFKY